MVGNALRAFLVLGLLLLLAHVILVRLLGPSSAAISVLVPVAAAPSGAPPPPPLKANAAPALAFTHVERDASTGGVIASAPTVPKDACADQADFEKRIQESPEVESFFRSRIVVDCARPGAGTGDGVGRAGPALLSGRGDGLGIPTSGLPGMFDGGLDGFAPY